MLSCTPAHAALRCSPWAEGSPQALQGCSSCLLPELLHWSPAGSASLYQQPASQDWLVQWPKRLTTLPQLGTALMGHPSPQLPRGQQRPHRDPPPYSVQHCCLWPLQGNLPRAPAQRSRDLTASESVSRAHTLGHWLS